MVVDIPARRKDSRGYANLPRTGSRDMSEAVSASTHSEQVHVIE